MSSTAELFFSDVADDVLENNGENGAVLSPQELAKVEVDYGRGDKRVLLTTKPMTINQLLKLVRP